MLVPMRVYTISDLSRTPPVCTCPTAMFGVHLQFVQPVLLSVISACSQSLASVHLKCISLPIRFKIKWNSTNVAGAFPTLKIIIILLWTRVGTWCCEHCSATSWGMLGPALAGGTTWQGNRNKLFKWALIDSSDCLFYFAMALCIIWVSRGSNYVQLTFTDFFTFTFGFDDKPLSLKYSFNIIVYILSQ